MSSNGCVIHVLDGWLLLDRCSSKMDDLFILMFLFNNVLIVLHRHRRRRCCCCWCCKMSKMIWFFALEWRSNISNHFKTFSLSPHMQIDYMKKKKRCKIERLRLWIFSWAFLLTLDFLLYRYWLLEILDFCWILFFKKHKFSFHFLWQNEVLAGVRPSSQKYIE